MSRLQHRSGRGDLARFAKSDQQRNRCSTAVAEDVARLLLSLLAAAASVAAQVVDVQVVEVLCDCEPQPVGGVAVDVAAVGHVGNDTAGRVVDHPVRCPPDGADVAVVERVLQRRRGLGRVRLGDPSVEPVVGEVCIVIVGRCLACRVRRVADDNADREFLLLDRTLRVPVEECQRLRLRRADQLERVGENDAGKGLVVVVGPPHQIVVGRLDVDGGDVVGEEQDVVGVDLARLLAHEVGRLDQPALQQSHDERAGAGERVKDVQRPRP